MTMYRKKPVEIRAVQLRPDNDDAILQFMQDTSCPFEIVGDHEVVIHTVRGSRSGRRCSGQQMRALRRRR